MTIMWAKQLAAQAFKPTSPAKLSDIATVTPQLEAGTGGTLKLHAMHLHDRLSGWASLTDVVGSATLIGTLVHNTPLNMPDWTPGPNEQILFWFAFDDSGGAPPTLLSLSVPWVSDVTAPDAPTISNLTGVLPEGGDVGYRADFNLPATTRYVIVEGKLNAGSWLPFSARAKMENGQGYMKFRGDLSQTEAAGERNETHLSFAKGLVSGDVVQVRVAALDEVGNQSAFTTSDAKTLTPVIPGTLPVLFIEDMALYTGETGVIRVHLIGISSETVTVDLISSNGTALTGTDFTAVSETLTFTGDANSGHRYAEVTMNAIGTDPQAGVKTYSLTLSNSSGPTIERSVGTVTILNSSSSPGLYIEDRIIGVNEEGTIIVHLIGANAIPISVDYASVDDTAVQPAHYPAISGTLTFQPSQENHQTAEINISAIGTYPPKSQKQYIVRLSNVVGNIALDKADGIVTIKTDFVEPTEVSNPGLLTGTSQSVKFNSVPKRRVKWI